MTVPLADPTLFRQACYIDGAWRTASATLPVDNPATGDILGTVPRLGAEETRDAVASAEPPSVSWRRATARERATILRRWADLMLAHQEDLATLMTLEQGKPLTESRGEVGYAASFLEWFGEEAKRLYGDTIPGHQADKRIVVIKQPIGVVACITPWNFPLAMVTRKVGPALAAGCTVVLKPASQTPFSALALAELAERAGVPRGVFNVVTGSAKAIGGELTSNPVVRKLSFTGSTETGKTLMAQCAGTLKKLSLELGGNAPFIVFDDADLDEAVAGAIASKYRNTGQTCVCANRLLVQDARLRRVHGEAGQSRRDARAGAGLEAGRRRDRSSTTTPSQRSNSTLQMRWRRARHLVARRPSSYPRRPLLRADGAHRRDRRDARRERRDLWAGRTALSLQDGRRGDCDGQRHGIRPGVLFLRPRHLARLARRRGTRGRHGRRQHRSHLHRSCALWRRQGIRPRPRGFEVSGSRSTSRSNTSVSGGYRSEAIGASPRLHGRPEECTRRPCQFET